MVSYRRVMLEDDSILGAPETVFGEAGPCNDTIEASRSESSSMAEVHEAESALDMAHDRSAFGSFSEVRRRLYTYGLALRGDDPALKKARNGRVSPAECKIDKESTDTQPLDTETPSSQSRTEEAARCGELQLSERGRPEEADAQGCEAIADGDDEWIVTEFRRVGASVKPVRVCCQVRAPVVMPNVFFSLFSIFFSCSMVRFSTFFFSFIIILSIGTNAAVMQTNAKQEVISIISGTRLPLSS